MWVPLAIVCTGAARNATTYPLPARFFCTPRRQRNEILIPYGRTQFGSKAACSPHHFMTVVSGAENLPTSASLALWTGAQPS